MMARRLLPFLLAVWAPAFAQVQDTLGDMDGRTEARSVKVEECTSGTCGASVTSVSFTEDRRAEAEIARRIMSDTKGPAPALGTPQTVDEH